jgi:hypothetical protein
MDDNLISRRQLLRAGAAAAVCAPAIQALEMKPAGTELHFRLVETAGLRRFGYPVHTTLPGVREGANFRLSRGKDAVPAQFRPITLNDGQPAIALDFNASPGPLATEDYIVSFGDGVDPGPEPKGGMRVESLEGIFRVSNGSILQFEVPGSLLGFLKSVTNSRQQFLRDQSEGLWIRYKDDIHYRVGGKGPNGMPTRGTVSREGPIAVSLRFEGTEALRGERSVKSVVTLTFPNSKSWVETTWTVDDPQGWVGGLGVDLSLAIEGEPTIVDLGASNTVYGYIKGKERMELSAGHAPGLEGESGLWLIRKGAFDRLEPFAVSPRDGSARAEGWAHVMDRSRCTALAMAGFGRSSRDRIVVDAAGRVRLWRDFAGNGAAPAAGPKSLTCWFHFVGNPVQVGAVTSPQAMLAPLDVVWEPVTR